MTASVGSASTCSLSPAGGWQVAPVPKPGGVKALMMAEGSSSGTGEETRRGAPALRRFPPAESAQVISGR